MLRTLLSDEFCWVDCGRLELRILLVMVVNGVVEGVHGVWKVVFPARDLEEEPVPGRITVVVEFWYGGKEGLAPVLLVHLEL